MSFFITRAWRPTILTVSILFIAVLTHAVTAQAQLKIDVTRGSFEPLPIAITGSTGAPADAAIGREVMQVVSADLQRSGLFRTIPEPAFIQQISDGDAVPRFADWRQINAQALVTSSVRPAGADSVTVSFRLWDTLGEQQIAGKEFTTQRGSWRRISHLIADEIYTRLTGEQGYFDSRIVYVAESGPATKRIKRLAIMDQDGAGHKFLTGGEILVLTPRFSPDSQEILYLSFGSSKPRVHLRDLQTGREEILGNFAGMSFAPRFANDGNRMLMSIANNGNTDIFEMDLRTRRMLQLTDHSAIDTSPSYAPDGRRIVFESDRGGSQQLYVMNANGSSPTRISFGDGRYATPVWSPRGDWIAFTKMTGGKFGIGIMRPDGSGERMLTGSWLDEGPTWSPNGRILLFSRQQRGGQPKLYSIDITGQNLREVVTPIAASDPAWSPLLPLQ